VILEPPLRSFPPPDLGTSAPLDTPGDGHEAPAEAPAGWPPAEIVDCCSRSLVAIDGNVLRTIGITSCQRGEGRSTVASAFALVQRHLHGRRTLLVELDLARPSLARALGLQPGPGVAEVLRGQAPLADSIQFPMSELGVLVAGDVGDDGPALTAQLPTSGIVRMLEASADAVVVDLPPLSVRAAARLARQLSEVVLVVRAGEVPMSRIRQAVAALDGPPPVILNRHVAMKPTWLDEMLGGSR
jgi:Mrp family chromosome partitioning ATPase